MRKMNLALSPGPVVETLNVSGRIFRTRDGFGINIQSHSMIDESDGVKHLFYARTGRVKQERPSWISRRQSSKSLATYSTPSRCKITNYDAISSRFAISFHHTRFSPDTTNNFADRIYILCSALLM
jgi:hypothetical protein